MSKTINRKISSKEFLITVSQVPILCAVLFIFIVAISYIRHVKRHEVKNNSEKSYYFDKSTLYSPSYQLNVSDFWSDNKPVSGLISFDFQSTSQKDLYLIVTVERDGGECVDYQSFEIINGPDAKDNLQSYYIKANFNKVTEDSKIYIYFFNNQQIEGKVNNFKVDVIDN